MSSENRDYITNPVITGNFKPKFYWTGNAFQDSERINRPHIKAEGENENRIAETLEIINDLSGVQTITLEDAFNIQNRLLKINNWKGIKPGFRFHNINFSEAAKLSDVTQLTEQMFPVHKMTKDQLLEWYRQIQIIHPLSDLNGRVFGIIVAILHS